MKKNLIRLKEIISEHGWPGQSMVGREAAIAAFLILQHASYETQVEYLPLVQAAVEVGELEGQWLAMLRDRILVSEGKPQISVLNFTRTRLPGDCNSTQLRTKLTWMRGEKNSG